LYPIDDNIDGGYDIYPEDPDQGVDNDYSVISAKKLLTDDNSPLALDDNLSSDVLEEQDTTTLPPVGPPAEIPTSEPAASGGSNATNMNGTNTTESPWVILPDGTNISSTVPTPLPADFQPLVAQYGITNNVTDQVLLTLYKGHDSSDRPGIREYGDINVGDLREGWNIWPSRRVEYFFEDGISNCAKTIFNIAASVVNDHSCIQLVEMSIAPRVEESLTMPILHVTEYDPNVDGDIRPGCSSSLGYVNKVGGNEIHFAPGCLNVGTALHLILHALGMFHEHQRPDRDSFVKILDPNIDVSRVGGALGSLKYEAVFGKLDSNIPARWIDSVMARDYDYSSIMQNGPCHYSTSEEFGGMLGGCSVEPTLTASPTDGLKYIGSPGGIGNRMTLSLGDKFVLNDMYACPISTKVFEAPSPSDVASVAAVQCTALDSADFEWSDRGSVVKANLPPANQQQVAMSDESSSSTSGAGSNEQSQFKYYIKDAATKKLIAIICIVAVSLVLLAGIAMFLYVRKQKHTYGGNRAAVVSAGDDDLSKALKEDGNGEYTDDEIIGELLDQGSPPTGPTAERASSPRPTPNAQATRG
jgi:hypothetical protein